MVHHIVMWNFKPEIKEEDRPALKAAMASNLKGLVGQVPGLLTAEFVEACDHIGKSIRYRCLCFPSGTCQSCRYLRPPICTGPLLP